MDNKLYTSRIFTSPGGFTAGIEGPACDREGNLYAVNYGREGTIGIVAPDGRCGMFVELPAGSTGNGIRFNRKGEMLIADYTGHNILKVDMDTREISVFAHGPSMNQPNDLAITAGDILFASDPDWKNGTGQLWRAEPDGRLVLLETGMGTTNGIEIGPDESILYVNETAQRRIWTYDLSPGGDIGNKRLLIEFPDYGLDGMRCDIAGNLYVARYGKGTVAQISPAGEVLLEVPLHGAKCTNVAFGGPDGCTCYVTVADNGNVESFRTELPGRSRKLINRMDEGEDR
jgi:sugar lactone lactonase YvrE